MKKRKIEQTPLEKELVRYVEALHAEDTSGHDFFHIQRVVQMAKHLAKKQNIDNKKLLLLSYLHDVDDPKMVGNSQGSSRALDIMKTCKIEEVLAFNIQSEISKMSYSAHQAGSRVESIEAKIVQDSDRLDAIGAIGIARAFTYGGSKRRVMFEGSFNDETSIAHFYRKLLHLEQLMNTKQAKKIAKKRTKLMRKYLKAFHEEWSIITK